MKDSTFTLNAKLFKEVEVVKKKIRDEIHSKCRGDDSGPSVKSAKSDEDTRNKALHWTSR